MKQILIFLLIVTLGSCQDVKIGYLKTDNASYLPNELEVRKSLDDNVDAVRIANEAPWVTPSIQGVLGTPPLLYEFVSVTASDGGDAVAFQKEIIVRGAGIMELPLRTSVPAGRYVVTLKVANEGYSAILQDIYTFVVKQ